MLILPANMPKVLGLVGPYHHARVLIEELGKFEPIAVIDADSGLHEALTDLMFNPGEDEDIDWHKEGTIYYKRAEQLRHWVDDEFGARFRISRVISQIKASEDSHSLYAIPNLRHPWEHDTLRTHFKPYEYDAIHIRDEQWLPPFDTSWTYDTHPPLIHQLEVGARPLITQLIDIWDPEAAIPEASS